MPNHIHCTFSPGAMKLTFHGQGRTVDLASPLHLVVVHEATSSRNALTSPKELLSQELQHQCSHDRRSRSREPAQCRNRRCATHNTFFVHNHQRRVHCRCSCQFITTRGGCRCSRSARTKRQAAASCAQHIG